MRQTSRAVALLLVLESAQAAATTWTATTPSNFNSGTRAAYLSAVNQMTSRTAPWTNTGVYTGGAVTAAATAWATPVASKINTIVVAALTDINLVTGATPCVACIAGGGVWCSRTYSYNYTGTLNYQAGSTANNVGLFDANLPASGTTTAGTTDNGACCSVDQAPFTTLAGGTELDYVATVAGTQTNRFMVPQACPAVVQGSAAPLASATQGTAKWGKYKLGLVSTTAYTSWWCSNGLFNTVTVSGTDNTANGVQMFTNPQQVANDTTALKATNARLELATVGCPQRSKACGAAPLIDLDLAGSTKTITMAKTLGNTYVNTGLYFTPDEKCTWVAYSVKGAPNFKIEKDTLGLTSNNWQIHQMEYTHATSYVDTAGSLKQAQAQDVFAMDDAVNYGNKVPLFNMPAAQFSTLRTWYGQAAGSTTGPVGSGLPAWYAPGVNDYPNAIADVVVNGSSGSQMWGNVANLPNSQWGSSTATTAAASPATATFGAIATTGKFDFRQIRFLPAQVPTTVYANGKAVQDQYTTALAAYNTAKTTWDAYVAILEKNSKQDAFAAAFSPPKAPTVPPLPNMPWVPAAYAGYLKQTPAQAGLQAMNSGRTYLQQAAQPTGQQVFANLAAAQTIGGWGSFTAQIFRFRDGWGKSFGTIGYSAGASALTMGQAWNYKWMCGAAQATENVGKACDATWTFTAGDTTTIPAPTSTAANAVPLVSVVSLWSLGNTGTLFTGAGNPGKWNNNSDFKITFAPGTWSDGFSKLTALAAPTAPVAAKSLTGLAGAQALAASTAAALAAAAALY